MILTIAYQLNLVKYLGKLLLICHKLHSILLDKSKTCLCVVSTVHGLTCRSQMYDYQVWELLFG